jgi:hypothetical protein
MAKTHPSITPEIQAFIQAQPMFFVASAPLSATGHVNLSPKGLDCLRVFDSHTVAYLDLTGSGNETSAHLRENGRITLMFCAFQGAPNILRLYGKGQTILPSHADWAELVAQFPTYAGIRQIIRVQVERVQTSCGFGVPFMQLEKQRDTLYRGWEVKGEQKVAQYQQEKNLCSIDGLPSELAG